MKKLITLFLLSFSTILFSQNKIESENPRYDAALAKKSGADDYGMKKYVIAFLKTGPNRNQDSATAVMLQSAHMANIVRMAEAGHLVVAGPFLDDSEIKGIYIFNVETIEQAKALTETDPAIKAGRLAMELHPWYGSAALMQTTQIHKTIQKKTF
ncbi:MAG: hypothetical protein JWO32_202 [Bacteroidetes bacterium]|nr:hypothetical protein [Bacteroidota bacterium]